MPFWGTQCCYGMLKPNPRGDVKQGAFIWPHALPVSRCFFRCFVVLGLFMTTEQVWAGWNLSVISCYVLLLSHPPSCFSFPFIFPFMLHTEVQLPRDKPQKAGQEGPVGKFGCKIWFSAWLFWEDKELCGGEETQSEMKPQALWVPQGHHPPGSALPNIFFLFSLQMHLPSLGLLHADKRDSFKRVESHSVPFRELFLPPGINYIPWLRRCSNDESCTSGCLATPCWHTEQQFWQNSPAAAIEVKVLSGGKRASVRTTKFH